MNEVYSLEHRNIRFMKEKSNNLDCSPSKLTSSAFVSAVGRIRCRNQKFIQGSASVAINSFFIRQFSGDRMLKIRSKFFSQNVKLLNAL